MNISRFKNRGFVGIDADLETSLMEYGVIWKKFKRAVKKYPCVKGEYLFITHEIDRDEKSHIDYAWFRPDTDVKEEFDWVEWDEFLSYMGQSYSEFTQMDFGNQVYALYSYYGKQNIFGQTYY